MKSTKRILATLLTLALALSLTLPAMAVVDWDEFRITKQPQDLTIKNGDSFTLSVEVNIPDGVEVEYRWQRDSSYIEGATAPELHLRTGDSFYPEFSRLGGDLADYVCDIIGYEKDAVGNVISSRSLRSDRVRVGTERTALGKLFDVTIGPIGYALISPVLMTPLIVVYPFAFLGFLVYYYYLGFKALFS